GRDTFLFRRYSRPPWKPGGGQCGSLPPSSPAGPLGDWSSQRTHRLPCGTSTPKPGLRESSRAPASSAAHGALPWLGRTCSSGFAQTFLEIYLRYDAVKIYTTLKQNISNVKNHSRGPADHYPIQALEHSRFCLLQPACQATG